MTQLLQNAAYGSALILAVAVLRRMLKERLLPGARLALWAACLIRLLTPAPLESVLSLWGLARLFERPEQAPAPMPNGAEFVLSPDTTPAFAPASQPAPAISWETVLAVLWLAVAAVLAARYVMSWRRTRRAVACAIPLDRTDPRYGVLPKCARLREGPMEGAPLTFGALRPTVVLSPGLSDEELDCVLAHEGVHARRRDNLWHYAMALALAVHWWNPAVWLMSRLLRRDIELSCDRAAMKKLGADRRADYAKVLVSLATQADGPAFCHTFGRKAAEERILSVMKFKKTTIVGVIFSLALVVAVTAAFASEPKQPSDTIEYLGQTYNRADLSQETLDWLDWYLSLPEAEQLKVSMVPPELIPGLNPAAYDAFPVDQQVDVHVDVNLGEVPDTVNIGGTLYDVKLPTSDENGDPEDNGIIGQRMMELDEYKALLDSLVAGGKMTQADADGLYTGAKQALENGGEALALYATGSGSYAIMNAPLCSLPECVDCTPHRHGTLRYSGHCPVPCTRMDCNNEGYHGHDGVVYDGTLPICTLTDCGSNTVHSHDGVQYKGWTGKSSAPVPVPSAAPASTSAQPLVSTSPAVVCACGVEGCAEIRYHAHNEGRCILLNDPCPVDGCTITGNHLHGDVCYSCNGAGHNGGHCDGTCYTYNPAGTTTTGYRHGESHSSGHHGNGHH